MFNTTNLTKFLAGLCCAWLVLLIPGYFASKYYSVGKHGHAAEAYVIEPVETGAAEEGPDFATLFATADASEGEAEFRSCRSCHSIVDGEHGTGPSLYGVFERDIASASGFGFSGALNALEGNWTAEALNGFLESPRGYANGTTMSFNGVRNAQDRANLIAYLQSLGG